MAEWREFHRERKRTTHTHKREEGLMPLLGLVGA
jgi:hypothetical protein